MVCKANNLPVFFQKKTSLLIFSSGGRRLHQKMPIQIRQICNYVEEQDNSSYHLTSLNASIEYARENFLSTV